MNLEDGSGNLRVSEDDTDQLMAATMSATAPGPSIGAPPRLNERIINIATPAIPIDNAKARRTVSLRV